MEANSGKEESEAPAEKLVAKRQVFIVHHVVPEEAKQGEQEEKEGAGRWKSDEHLEFIRGKKAQSDS